VNLSKAFYKSGLGFAGVSGVFLARLLRELSAKKGEKHLKVLDIGSGSGRPWSLVSIYLGDPSLRIELTAIDAVPGRSHGSKDLGESLSGFHQVEGELFEACSQIDTDSFDLVVCMDVIEHLSKSDGYRLVYEMNRITSSSLALSCPNGFVWQPPSKDNPFQAHISGWSVKDFRSLGLTKIKGFNGLKILTGSYAKKKYTLSIATSPIFFLETLVSKLAPGRSSLIWGQTVSKLQLSEDDEPGVIDRLILRQ
jgi:SAM-dependent methyltransferase